MQFGERLRGLREDRGWSQQEAAERAGVSHTHIRALELGRHAPTIRVVRQLARAFGVPVTALIGMDGYSDSVLDEITRLASGLTPERQVLLRDIALSFGAARNHGAVGRRTLRASLPA
jgi:transcriptional regulator with XRE-family HTH domain